MSHTVRYRQQQTYRTARCIAALAAAAITALAVLAAGKVAADPTTPAGVSGVVISEAQTGGCGNNFDSCVETPAQEFVEIHNPTSSDCDVTGWKLAYVSASGSTTTVLAELHGHIAAGGSVLLAHAGHYEAQADLHFGSLTDSGKLAKSGGHLRLLDADGQWADNLGWGSAAGASGQTASAPAPGYSLQRNLTAEGLPSATGDNATDFAAAVPTPSGGGLVAPSTDPAPDDDTPPADPEDPPAEAPAEPPCSGVVISEVLPNPAGSDGGVEYIELRNTGGSRVDLDGCRLQVDDGSDTFDLTGVSIEAGGYRHFGDGESGLVLPNAAGGTVWLLAGDVELSTAAYPQDLADDVAWASVDGSWVETFMPTPGLPNIWIASEPCPTGQERSQETNRCITITQPDGDVGASGSASPATGSTLTPCQPGQERNPATNRCRSTTGSSSLTPCKPGQARNPETNRCSGTVATASTSLQACKPGQERNPETNRCRTATATSSEAKACPAGQERNPDTNRCRKALAAAGSSTDIPKVEDVKSPVSADRTRWLAAGLVIAGAIAYGIYEWRHELGMRIRAITGRQPSVRRA